MIIVSGILALAAIGLLIAGVSMPMSVLVMVSIGVSLLSFIFLALGVFRHRKELFGPMPNSPNPQVPDGAMAAAVPVAAGMPSAGALGAQRPPLRVPREDLVFVVPGRMRYHLADCQIIEGRDKQALTRDEAREERFSPCTTCEPDGPSESKAAEPADTAVKPDAEEAERAAAETPPAPEPAEDPLEKSPSTRPTMPKSRTMRKPGTWESAFKRPAPAEEDDEAETTEAAAEDEPEETGPPPGTGDGEKDSAAESPPEKDETPAKPAEDATESPGKDTDRVKIITGTRRFHSSECPLIKGADESGIETMTRKAAETAGLTHCSVCGFDDS